MNSMTTRRLGAVCKLEFINKFNVVVSFRDLENIYNFVVA